METFKCLPSASFNSDNPTSAKRLGNTFSDTMAALFDPTLQGSVKGITIGCIVPILIMIPIIEWMKRKKDAKK